MQDMILECVTNFISGNLVTVSLLFTVIALYVYRTRDDTKGMPRGPWGLPLFGYVPFMTDEPYRDFVKLAKKYGDVFRVRLGSNTFFVINGYDAMKESYIKNGEVYTGVMKKGGIVQEFGDHRSIFVTDGEIWKEQRRFLLSTLRDFGFGKNRIEEHIREEAKIAIDELTKLSEKSWDLSQLFCSMTCNIISFLTFGRRFGYDDKEIVDSIDQLNYLNSRPFIFDLANLFPVLLKFPKTWTPSFRMLLHFKNTIYGFVDRIKTEHSRNFDANNVVDVMDTYIKKSKQLVANGHNLEETVYTDKHMKANMLLLFAAGTDTTASTLAWAVKFLAANPDIQKELQEEIDDVIGRNRLPTMSDRPEMPLMEAFILELQRYISLLPLTAPRRAIRETKLKEYTIPKDSTVVLNLWSVLRDPNVWDQPEQFNFRRFLDSNNKVSSLREKVVAFSTGKRNCLGESLAKMEIFIFLTSFVQHFTFRPPDSKKLTFECSFFPLRKVKTCILRAVPR